jgi:hypothetical protein
MYTFDNLDFIDDPLSPLNRAKLFFSNGYGVSVITGETAYSSDDRPYELAVLKGTEEDFNLCYDTPITDDVVGYQTAEEVTQLMLRIQHLPPNED